MSSSDIKAKQGDLINLLCSAQSESPITFNWEKDQKPLESFMEKEQPHRSSLLVVKIKDEESFGKYVCRIQDGFQSTTHTISIQEDTGNVFHLFMLNNSNKTGRNPTAIKMIFCTINGQNIKIYYASFYVEKMFQIEKVKLMNEKLVFHASYANFGTVFTFITLSTSLFTFHVGLES